MTCVHRGPFDDGLLPCVRVDSHLTGHVYETSDGSAADDCHDDKGHG